MKREQDHGFSSCLEYIDRSIILIATNEAFLLSKIDTLVSSKGSTRGLELE
jgi:hypothetical protein